MAVKKLVLVTLALILFGAGASFSTQAQAPKEMAAELVQNATGTAGEPPIIFTPPMGISISHVDVCSLYFSDNSGGETPWGPIIGDNGTWNLFFEALGWDCSNDAVCTLGEETEGWEIVGTHFPYADPSESNDDYTYISPNLENSIFPRFLVCRSEEPDASNNRYLGVQMVTRLNAGEPYTCSNFFGNGDCDLHNGPYFDYQTWSLTQGKFVDFTPDPRIEIDEGSSEVMGISFAGYGATWEQHAVKVMVLEWRSATATKVEFTASADGALRDREAPSYGAIVQFEDGGNVAFNYDLDNRFYRTKPGPDSAQAYLTSGSFLVESEGGMP